MSINRMLLRTAVVAALTPAKDDPYPITMAGREVYDSRLDPVEHLDRDDGDELPIIAVYTDDHEHATLNNDYMSGMVDSEVSVRIEFTIASFDTVDVQGHGARRVLVYPTIDAEIEARLDLFEQQIIWALFDMGWRPATQCFLKMVKSVNSVKSVVVRDEDGGNRVASRQLTFGVCVAGDCKPAIGIGNRPVAPAKFELADFPGAPWLAGMLNVMASSPNRHAVIDVLSTQSTAAVYLPLLKRIGMKVDAIDPEADPNRFVAGQTQGPDGRIEVEAVVEINK